MALRWNDQCANCFAGADADRNLVHDHILSRISRINLAYSRPGTRADKCTSTPTKGRRHYFECHTQQVISDPVDWNSFRHSVKNRNRYILGSSILGGGNNDGLACQERFLKRLLSSLSLRNRFVTFDQGKELWRAQLDGTRSDEANGYEAPNPPSLIPGNKDFELRVFLTPHNRVRMTPHSDKAKEGRVNPKGIPCLYAATDLRVALTEMKPTIGSFLTLAKFVTVRELRIVDFASERIEIADSKAGLTADQWDSLFWEEINDAFAESVTPTDNIADYAPTQIVAELFKLAGYDGIRYKSKCSQFESLQPRFSQERLDETRSAKPSAGLNVALFNISDATFLDSTLYRFAVTTHGGFDFREVKQFIPLTDQDPELA